MKYNEIQITDITIMKKPNIGRDLLQNWVFDCAHINNSSKIDEFIKSTKSSSATTDNGATSLPPIGNSFFILNQLRAILKLIIFIVILKEEISYILVIYHLL